MSDPKLISPLLDGFVMGAPMSSHDGVVCCPAIKENTENKYIVKIITVPAAQAQLDALLLAGAYRDPADAMEYFRQVGEDIMQEAELLKTLSKLEGFLSYEGWQMEPITSKRLGYQVYLVGSYKRTLEKYVRRNPVTHLEAVNLGLDLCTALSVCRQAGALYVDLKPTNVFISEKKEYRIGDLGFVKLDALKYTALPDKYRSAYTPPELHDPMATLNLTTDTYAVGMILYQLYNDGQLPSKDNSPEEAYPMPVNADYELAEIIMKAIHPDPAQRWEDPTALGQALVGYMQRNVINDVPITPYKALELSLEDTVFLPRITEEMAQAAKDSELAPPSEETPQPPAAEEDETAPGEEDAQELLPHEMSEEMTKMMAKADDLISHEAPDGVVLPEIPDKPDPFAFVDKSFDEVDDIDTPYDPVMDEESSSLSRKREPHEPGFGLARKKSWKKRLLSPILVLAIMALMGLGMFWYYQNIYLQRIDSISITGDRSELTVTVVTDIEDALLTVSCADNYGNVMAQPLSGGQATFTELRPNTMYRIGLQIEGRHELVGQTSDVFTTDTSTNIVSFTAVTGPEDGSVILSFTADGEEPEEWTVVYSAEGEKEKRKYFSGHSVTIDDLAVSKIYTFTLENGDEPLSGSYTLSFMASRLILAENLTITSTGSNDMTVHWNAPGDIVVDNWNVRCYNGNGYEEQLTVQDTEVHFTGIDFTQSYTVEVTAAGMTQPARTSITENPINITACHVDESNLDQLTLTWEHTGEVPEGGWLVMYSVDGSSTQSVARCDTASTIITPRFPGADYQFTIQAADATSIFGNVYSYTCPDADLFGDHGLSSEDITAQLVKTPDKKNWHFGNVGQDAVTDQFAVGDSISIILHGDTNFYLPGSSVKLRYVLEDAHGNVLPGYAAEEKHNWKDIWYAGDYHYGELDIPKLPETAGKYKVTVYIDGLYLAQAEFTLS